MDRPINGQERPGDQVFVMHSHKILAINSSNLVLCTKFYNQKTRFITIISV